MADDLMFGARLRLRRERAGKTRKVLGGLVGRSEEWVKALERGTIQMPRLPMLLRLADVLGVQDLAELTGGKELPVAALTKNAHGGLEAVRDAMISYRLPDVDSSLSLDGLARRVAQAWRVWHGTSEHRTALAALLPDLLRDVRAAARGADDRRRALQLLVQVHHLAQVYLAFQPAPELVWTAADRALSAAYDADCLTSIAGAAWYTAQVHQATGQADKAVQIALDAARLLPGLDTPDKELRSSYGLTHLAASWAYATLGEEGPAWREWDLADTAARSLGDDYAHPSLMFGRGIVDAYAMLLDTDLFHTGRAVERASRIDLDAIPSRTRRAVHALNAARAHRLRKEHFAVLHLIGQAYQHSSETVRYRPWARETVLDLMHKGGPGVRSAALEMASKVGVTD